MFSLQTTKTFGVCCGCHTETAEALSRRLKGHGHIKGKGAWTIVRETSHLRLGVEFHGQVPRYGATYDHEMSACVIFTARSRS